MKTFEVRESDVVAGIPVSTKPYPKVVLGQGGHKRATWIPIGRQDQASLIKDDDRILSAAVIITKEKQKPLIVLPRNKNDNRVLVLWRVKSGYRGSASINAPEGVKEIAQDSAWHSGQGNLGETAEILAILEPGQHLEAHISGRRVQENRARLSWDGETIAAVFYNSDASPFDDEGEEL